MTDLDVTREVLAIIPARGGSKGIPRKNIADLCGKPLIAYSIEAALNAETITRVIVSTEDTEISEIAQAFGAEVPFLRPKELAGDRAHIGDAIKYTLDLLEQEGFRPDVVVQLYPTHLFRNPNLLNFLIGKLINGYVLVKTVKPIFLNPLNMFFIPKRNRLLPLIASNGKGRAQSMVCYRSYGLFYGYNLTGGARRNIYLHKLTDPISLIDIDTYSDLYLAKEVINRKLFDFKRV